MVEVGSVFLIRSIRKEDPYRKEKYLRKSIKCGLRLDKLYRMWYNNVTTKKQHTRKVHTAVRDAGARAGAAPEIVTEPCFRVS